MPNLAKIAYVERVNRAIDFITENLDAPLALDDIARVACFSSSHFHRIFRGVTGEPLAQFIKRLRLERAVYLMSHRRGASLTEIALATGLGSSSAFSRSFRAHFGVAPSAFDVDAYRAAKRPVAFASPLAAHDNPDGFAVRILEVPARRVAYTRVINGYAGGLFEAAERMLAWARSRGLEHGQWLGFQWDDPEIVALEHCRYDLGIEIPPGVDVGDVNVIDLAPMRLGEIPIAGSIELELRALDWLYGSWLPTSGYAPDHQPMFEAFDGEPFAHGATHFELRVQLAIVDASEPL